MSEDVWASRIAYIYTLSDPRDPDAVRYVGVTRRPHMRLREHLTLTVKAESYNGHWLRSLLRQSAIPAMTFIDVAPLGDANAREMYWIDEYLKAGANLTNSTAGGGQTFVFLPDVVAKMVAAGKPARDAFMSGLTPEQRRERMAPCWTVEARIKRNQAVSRGVQLQWGNRSAEQRDAVSGKIALALRHFNQGLSLEQRKERGAGAALGRRLKIEAMSTGQLAERKARDIANGIQSWKTRIERYTPEQERQKQIEGIYRVPAEERSRRVKIRITAWLERLTDEQREVRRLHMAGVLVHARQRYTEMPKDVRTAAAIKAWNTRRTNTTPEELAECQRKSHEKRLASLSPEARSAMARKSWATRRATVSPEELKRQHDAAMAKRAAANALKPKKIKAIKMPRPSLTPEQRSEIARKREAAKTPEQRIAVALAREAKKRR